MSKNQFINFNNFILATRDSGYKNFSSAIAELIDNSFEANATIVNINIKSIESISSREYEVYVYDNGNGMDKKNLKIALQFGGSTRFNSRKGNGRYGMGLPNSSLNQAKRVEVFSWKNENKIYWTFFDIDEALEKNTFKINEPRQIKRQFDIDLSDTGTIIYWSKCDRIKNRYLKPIINEIKKEMGRIYRYQLINGKKIFINAEKIKAFDPLFLNSKIKHSTAKQYGPQIDYKIKVPSSTKTSIVSVKFTELPIKKWHDLSNKEKRENQITKNAGVSILRARREIDYGWFFMGNKRKENYDDWWRCEVSFEPELDELFGVTHTKQEIHPKEIIEKILSPDIERISRDLHKNVREKFARVKSENKLIPSEKIAERLDFLMEPPSKLKITLRELQPKKLRKKRIVKGLNYKLKFDKLKDEYFYLPILKDNSVNVTINSNHLFFNNIYSKISNSHSEISSKEFLKMIELLLFSVSRAEVQYSYDENYKILCSVLRREWSNNLANYLQ